MQQPVGVNDLQKFVSEVQGLITTHYTENLLHSPHPVVSFMMGSKYVRIVSSDRMYCSVYCFIDLATGDILKSDGWKKPAKHPRGNIFNDDPLEGCGVYGARYLR